MEDADGVAVFGEDFGETLVAVGRFVEASAAELDSGARSASLAKKFVLGWATTGTGKSACATKGAPLQRAAPATPVKAAKGQRGSWPIQKRNKLRHYKAEPRRRIHIDV